MRKEQKYRWRRQVQSGQYGTLVELYRSIYSIKWQPEAEVLSKTRFTAVGIYKYFDVVRNSRLSILVENLDKNLACLAILYGIRECSSKSIDKSVNYFAVSSVMADIWWKVEVRLRQDFCPSAVNAQSAAHLFRGLAGCTALRSRDLDALVGHAEEAARLRSENLELVLAP